MLPPSSVTSRPEAAVLAQRPAVPVVAQLAPEARRPLAGVQPSRSSGTRPNGRDAPARGARAATSSRGSRRRGRSASGSRRRRAGNLVVPTELLSCPMHSFGGAYFGVRPSSLSRLGVEAVGIGAPRRAASRRRRPREARLCGDRWGREIRSGDRRPTAGGLEALALVSIAARETVGGAEDGGDAQGDDGDGRLPTADAVADRVLDERVRDARQDERASDERELRGNGECRPA